MRASRLNSNVYPHACGWWDVQKMRPKHRMCIIYCITYSTLPLSWFFTYVKWNKRINGQNDNFILNWLAALENYYKFWLSCSIVLSSVYILISSNLQIRSYMFDSVLSFFAVNKFHFQIYRELLDIIHGRIYCRIRFVCTISVFAPPSVCVCEREREFFPPIFSQCASYRWLISILWCACSKTSFVSMQKCEKKTVFIISFSATRTVPNDERKTFIFNFSKWCHCGDYLKIFKNI